MRTQAFHSPNRPPHYLDNIFTMLCLACRYVQAADRTVKRKQRPPQHEYIRFLVYERLPLGQVTKARTCMEGGADVC